MAPPRATGKVGWAQLRLATESASGKSGKEGRQLKEKCELDQHSELLIDRMGLV